jgi:hypothetical protein
VSRTRIWSWSSLVDAEVLRISATVARRMGTGDLRVARAFLDELSERALSFVYEIPGSAFDRIVLLEPARLIQEQGWNQGS